MTLFTRLRPIASRLKHRVHDVGRGLISKQDESRDIETQAEGGHQILASYATVPPSNQAAVDIFKDEWSSRLPDDLGVTSGTNDLFNDDRIRWLLERTGSLDGKSVLELGPLEGGHTAMLERAGSSVVAIESNSHAYLKCLITKELLQLQRARFLRGDFLPYLRDTTETFDLVLASGVLYHMVQPVLLLELLTTVSDRIAIWTHYFDADVIMDSHMSAQFRKPVDWVKVNDHSYALHPRDYLGALGWGGFCGGPNSYARWMTRDDILFALASFGFSEIDIGYEQPDHQNGPAFMLYAVRSS